MHLLLSLIAHSSLITTNTSYLQVDTQMLSATFLAQNVRFLASKSFPMLVLTASSIIVSLIQYYVSFATKGVKIFLF